MKKLILLLAATMVASSCNTRALERLEPREGCYFGFTLGEKTVAEFSSGLGFAPAVYSKFFAFPLTTEATGSLDKFLQEVNEADGIAMITLEPWGGLGSVNQWNCKDLATQCATWEARGLAGIFIRFAHEMNGNWYPWGQKPIVYRAVFRMLSQAIHAQTKRTAMIWAPNYGVGYPFGTPVPKPGTVDFLALDTNGDGQITGKDDPYAPYYPGDDAVDWAGMTIYHWGVTYPWFENEMPPPNSFAGSLLGTYQGKLPNFYQEYSVRHGKPLVVPETAAFYNTEQPGPDPLSVKQAWWRQVFAATTQFPKLKCINWFDELKRESEAQNSLIDWRVSADPSIRAAFVGDFQAVRVDGKPYFITAPLDMIELSIHREDSALVLNWPSKQGRKYQLYNSPELTTWAPVGRQFQGTGNPIRLLVDSNSIAMNYRVLVVH
jgi:hypothetical protein